MTTVILRKGITQARLDAALAAKKTLTDYANVVVVDAGGAGDYPTLAAALTAITDAAANKRYMIWLASDVTEVAALTWKDHVDLVGNGRKVTLAQATNTFAATARIYNAILSVPMLAGWAFVEGVLIGTAGQALPDLRFINCAITGYVQINASSGDVRVFEQCEITGLLFGSEARVEIAGCKITLTAGSYAGWNDPLMSGAYRLLDCIVTSAVASAQMITVANSLIAERTRVETTGSSGRAIQTESGAILTLTDCIIVATATNGYGLYLNSNTLTMQCVRTHFESLTANRAVRAGSAFASAPLYQCTFKGGVTNVTAAAGTANGTCVTF